MVGGEASHEGGSRFKPCLIHCLCGGLPTWRPIFLKNNFYCPKISSRKKKLIMKKKGKK